MFAAQHRFLLIAAAAMAVGLAPAARANIVLSQVILDVKPNDPPAQDIEVWNNSGDRTYVSVEPTEVIAPGTPDEHRAANPDPAISGILVSPQRLILEANQRRLIRVGLVGARLDRDRIYRIAIKPVAGDVSASATALKVMVGYDALVIYRPEKLDGTVTGVRSGSTITFTNAGNTNVEMFEGRQCGASGAPCRRLPATRLYAGAKWSVAIDPALPVEYRLSTAGETVFRKF